jgi:hypothetical protein
MKTIGRFPCLEGEEWKTIPGFNDRYCVSNKGRVWSAPKQTGRGLRTTRPDSLLKQYSNAQGYRLVALKITSKTEDKSYLVHRLVLLAFIGDSDLWALHYDGNEANNNLENLRYGTPQDNSNDGRRLGELVRERMPVHLLKKKSKAEKAAYDNAYRDKNLAIIREKNRQRYLNNREKYLLKTAKYRQDHPEKMKEWRANNREHVLEYSKQYHKNHTQEATRDEGRIV